MYNLKALDFGVDVSDVKEQRTLPENIKFVVVRTSIAGDWLPNGMYGSDNAKYQIEDAKTKNINLMCYHGANFGGSVINAEKEANFAVEHAINYGIPEHSYLALDWETKATDNVKQNTKAIETFLDIIKGSDYQPLLYIGEYYLKNIDLDYLESKYGRILWLASYLHGKSLSEKYSEMAKYPVKICQYADNYLDKYDANIIIQDIKLDEINLNDNQETISAVNNQINSVDNMINMLDEYLKTHYSNDEKSFEYKMVLHEEFGLLNELKANLLKQKRRLETA